MSISRTWRAGWRFIVEDLRRAGMEPHLAKPADTRAEHGPKRRAKTDRANARFMSITYRLDAEIDMIDHELVPVARQLPTWRVLTRQWGVGPLTEKRLGDRRNPATNRPLAVTMCDARPSRPRASYLLGKDAKIGT